MQRFLENYSSCLSFLTVIMLVVAFCVTDYLDGRATWSGEIAPAVWSASAKADDIFEVAGHKIAYWGDPDAKYSKYATRKRRSPVAVIVHHTAVKPVKNLVAYGHMSDPNRGGASFGYHFYVGRDGNIVQGAPLSRRTNHIKFSTNKQRRPEARHLWSGNTIGVSLVGGCDPLLRPRWGQWRECSDEFITRSQLDAGLAVIRALQTKFGMKCEDVYGHGDLQYDRQSFEGLKLSRLARRVCEIEEAEKKEQEPEETPLEEAAAVKPIPAIGAKAVAETTSKKTSASGS